MQEDGDGLSQDEVSDEDVRAERNRRIAILYPDHSATKIAEIIGLSVPTIYAITKELGLTKKRGRPQKTFEQLIISPDHVRIGNRFAYHTSWVMKMDNVDVAKALGWSPQKVSLIGKGHHDLTLTDMKIMAAFTGMTVSELTKDV